MNVCLASDSPALKLARLCTPATVRSLEIPDGPWTFPLKVAYDLANYTYEGRKECLQYTQPIAFEVLADDSNEPRNQRSSIGDY